MTQNSKQSQNYETKKKSVSDFHNSCNVKERKELGKHNVIWKTNENSCTGILIDIIND